MSDIVEKTIYSLHGLISGSSHRDLVVRNRDFQNLVDAVSGVTNKHVSII